MLYQSEIRLEKSLIFPGFLPETQKYQQRFFDLNVSILQHFRNFILKTSVCAVLYNL